MIGKLIHRFRNQIREKEIEAYKQAIRERVFNSYHTSGNERQPFQEERQLNISAAIMDFEFSSLEKIIEEIEEEGSHSSRSSRPFSYQKSLLTLDDIEVIVDVCVQDNIYLNVFECLELIPGALFNIVDDCLHIVLQNDSPASRKLFQRIKHLWVISTQVLLNRYAQKFIKNEEMRDEELYFLVDFILHRILFLQGYGLLSEESILKANEDYIRILCEVEDIEGGIISEKILVVFLYLNNLKSESSIIPFALYGFVDSQFIVLINQISHQNSFSQFMLSADMLLQMLQFLLTDSLPYKERQRIVKHALSLGIAILEKGEERADLTQPFMYLLLRLIKGKKIYEWQQLQETIVLMSSSLVYWDSHAKQLDTFAIHIIGLARGFNTLTKMIIHFTYSMNTTSKEDRNHCIFCIELINETLARLEKEFQQ